MYEYTDKIIKILNKKYIKLFNDLKKLKIDELNVISPVTKVYETAKKLAKESYIELALWYYDYIIKSDFFTEEQKKKAHKLTKKQAIDLVEEMLEDYNAVTLYVFNHEVDRKKTRLFEALNSTNKRNEEIKKALRYWVLQSSQYADAITDIAVEKAFIDNGVQKVKWITQEDERVCTTCNERHNKVYDIDKIPDKAHYNCRCYVIPIRSSNDRRKDN